MPDPVTRDELILHFLPVVETVVSSYLWNNPHFSGSRDEFESAGAIKLIESVDRCLAKKSTNLAYIKNYVRISILTGIVDYLRENSMVPGPKTKGVQAGELRFAPLDPRSLHAVGITKEDLEAACDTPEQRVLVAMALRGENRKSIAAAMCITQIEVKKRLQQVLERAQAHGI